jgi:putative restriction endonuclease
MRISRRTSGGRGEYEISEVSTEGLAPTELLQRRLVLDLGGGWRINTGTNLTRQGGKRRIRLLGGTEIHLHLQVAAALLLPHPVRADEALGRGAPVPKTGQYAIEHIRLSRVRLAGTDTAVLSVEELELRNRSYQAEELGFANRVRHLERIWGQADNFPEEVANLLHAHRALVTAGGPIPQAAERIVSDLQLVVSQTAPDFGIVYYDGNTDVLVPLLEALSAPPEPPIAVDTVDPDEVEIRRRTVKEWKRWANARGSASARFRHAVRTAYNYTCVVCGVHLPATRYNNPGVDAAHILPWAEYDLDQVSNGLCLCRHHHWAFDEGLVVVRFRDGAYYLEIPAEITAGLRAEGGRFSLDELLRFVGRIPEDRLPQQPNQRPHPQFLETLNGAS